MRTRPSKYFQKRSRSWAEWTQTWTFTPLVHLSAPTPAPTPAPASRPTPARQARHAPAQGQVLLQGPPRQDHPLPREGEGQQRSDSAGTATAFEEGRYRDAEESARLALSKQPKNDQAEEIRTAAFRADRQQVQADYIVKKSEQFKKYREELEEEEEDSGGGFALVMEGGGGFWVSLAGAPGNSSNSLIPYSKTALTL